MTKGNTTGEARAPLVTPGPDLTAEHVKRYARHAVLPQLGVEGQRRLLNAKVLVVGAGGLGSPVLMYLAAAGVGHLGVVDSDLVETSNLQRQVIHGVDTVGAAKVDSARRAIGLLNPDVQVTTYHGRLDADNALDVLDGWDLVVDATDNFAARYLIADACEIRQLPCVWGSILRFDGQVTTFWPGRGPLYRDIFPVPPDPRDVPSCAEAGVIGALCAAVGSTMAMETIRLLTGIGRSLVGRLLIHDALESTWNEIPVRPDPRRTPVTALADYENLCEVPGAADPTDAASDSADDARLAEHTITADDLAVLLTERDRGDMTFTLVDVREPGEHHLVTIDTAQSIPLRDVLDNPAVIPADTAAVLFCKSGARSARALQAVLNQGRDDVWHLDGGLMAWIDAVEPHKPRY